MMMDNGRAAIQPEIYNQLEPTFGDQLLADGPRGAVQLEQIERRLRTVLVQQLSFDVRHCVRLKRIGALAVHHRIAVETLEGRAWPRPRTEKTKPY